MAITLIRNVSTGALKRHGVIENSDSPRDHAQKSRLLNGLRSLIPFGLVYHKYGVPSEEPTTAGAFCIDTNSKFVYVCVNRETPTWTKVVEV